MIMHKNLLITGFGVIGTEVFYQIIKKNKSHKLNITVLEKNYSNFPGGIAYSSYKSRFGFFNNPLRLSNDDFQKWVKKSSVQIKLIKLFKAEKKLNLENWLKKNTLGNLNKFKNINELYLPRLTYSIFLEEKFFKAYKILEKKKFIKVNFLEGELIKVSKLKNTKKYLCYVNKNFRKKKIIYQNEKIFIKNLTQKKQRILKTDSLILGLGILPPSNINSIKPFKDKNYIHDFYASGATNNLFKKLKKIQKLKEIIVAFIGNKAGLLETMQEFENLDKKILKKIKIISISSSSFSLEKAELSKNFENYKFKYLTTKKILKIKRAEEILSFIKSEFKNGIKKKFSKYDIWTLILKKNLLEKCIKKLSMGEKKNYNDKVFSQLRKLTRYTYPDTVNSKIRLEKRKILINYNDKVFDLKKLKNKILLKTKKGRNILVNIVVNVSGPVPLSKNYKEVPCINSLKEICKNYNERGFISDQYNQIGKKIYAPGTLSSNFNPNRKTIIKSITQNCIISASHIIKCLRNQNEY